MREKILLFFFEKGTFPYKGNVFKTKEEKSEEESEDESEEESEEERRVKKFIKYIENKSKGIKYDLFKKHFCFVVPSALVIQLYEIKKKKKNDSRYN